MAAVLAGVRDGSGLAVLDLGPGAASTLEEYGRVARVIRFADVRGHMSSAGGKGSVAGMLEAVPTPARPYDLVFGWDVLDGLFPEYRAALVERLAAVTGPGGHLHVVIRGKPEAASSLRFCLVGPDRMRYEATGPPESSRRPLLPAQVATMLEPFQVEHGFTLKGGLREYVAVRPRTPRPRT